MTEVKFNIDVGALATPITRLVEMADRHLDPFRIRRAADAEAYARMAAAKAEIEIGQWKDDAEIARMERAIRGFGRMLGQLELEQGNLEAIFEIAEGRLPASGQPGTVDEGWAGTFMDAAKYASDEHVREMFARLLAAEVTTPGAYSKRTLRTLQNLSPDEARVFTLACCLSLRFNSITFLPIGTDSSPTGMSFGDCLILDNCGLLHATGSLTWTVDAGAKLAFASGERIQVESQQPGAEIPCYPFTLDAVELSKVVSAVTPTGFVEATVRLLRDGHRLQVTRLSP